MLRDENKHEELASYSAAASQYFAEKQQGTEFADFLMKYHGDESESIKFYFRALNKSPQLLAEKKKNTVNKL